MFFDPGYLLFVMLPGMAISAWASWRVKSAFSNSGVKPPSVLHQAA